MTIKWRYFLPVCFWRLFDWPFVISLRPVITSRLRASSATAAICLRSPGMFQGRKVVSAYTDSWTCVLRASGPSAMLRVVVITPMPVTRYFTHAIQGRYRVIGLVVLRRLLPKPNHVQVERPLTHPNCTKRLQSQIPQQIECPLHDS
jgi:hypothetical protein